MSDTLIIPDSHAKPDQTLRRFQALGNYIAIKQPKKIKHLGDLFDMPSLCSYDKGKKSFEGRRYANDIKAGRKALELLRAPTLDYNRRHAKTQYNPQLDFIVGNHEIRINRAIEEESWLDGAISFSDLGLVEAGWTVHPFLEPFTDDGITFMHYFPSGPKDGAMSGPNLANNLVRVLHGAATCGHLHAHQTGYGFRADGSRFRTHVAGCFLEEKEEYMSPFSQLRWWRGVTLYKDVRNGDYEMEEISIESLIREYL